MNIDSIMNMHELSGMLSTRSRVMVERRSESYRGVFSCQMLWNFLMKIDSWQLNQLAEGFIYLCDCKMSQQQQRVRRMASPSSSKQGPMKAILHFGLKSQPQELSKSHQNGRKNSPNSSPTPVKSSENHRKTRKSPDFRSSPERSSPSSPGFNKGTTLSSSLSHFDSVWNLTSPLWQVVSRSE